MRDRLRCWIVLVASCLLAAAAHAQGAAGKPNILVIFGDDIGQTNISAYSFGVVGYKTPNIDRIAKEGMMFTDYYAENSCTAGRSSFITGQTPQAHRPVEGRHPGRAGRPADARRHDRPGAEAARLRDRAVRQEPPRRPRRVPADQPRLRRVLRQPLPPERGRGAGAPVLAEGRRALRRRRTRRAASCTASPTARSRTPVPLNSKRMETIDDETTAAAIDVHATSRSRRASRSSPG